jgi:hypothetical protein
VTRPAFNHASLVLVEAIIKVFHEYKPPLTVRQVYYQLATRGLVPLSAQGYRQAQRLLLRVREEEIIPWEWFADRTRRRVQAPQWDDASDFVDTVRGAYRRDLWATQVDHVEFWLEKDALSAFVESVLNLYGVPLCVCRGFGSATFIHEAAAALNEISKDKYVYYLGDHDPSGVSIETALRERLTEFGADFNFRRLAVTLDDIRTFGLRPLEAKRSDSRYRSYVELHGDETIELDALPPNELRRRIREAVEAHIDSDEWERLRRIERVERDSIASMADALRTTLPQQGGDQ